MILGAVLPLLFQLFFWTSVFVLRDIPWVIAISELEMRQALDQGFVQMTDLQTWLCGVLPYVGLVSCVLFAVEDGLLLSNKQINQCLGTRFLFLSKILFSLVCTATIFLMYKAYNANRSVILLFPSAFWSILIIAELFLIWRKSGPAHTS